MAYTIKVLLIEDDDDDFVIIRNFLKTVKRRKFQTFSCTSLKEGMEVIRNNPPDVVLLDLSLPDSKGIESFLKINEAFPSVPVMILTGLDDRNAAYDAVRKGAQDFLNKGQIDADLLERSIIYAIERNSIQRELNAANQALKHLLAIDPLTELLNRRGLQQALSETSSKFERFGQSSHAFLLDLDNFKRINDEFGHSVGDIVLKEVGKKIKETLRPTDFISRIGGDEFIVILPETREAEAVHIAQRIRRAIAQTNIALASGEPLCVTSSIGVVSIVEHSLSVDELLEKSHLALAKSKRTGKNLVTYQREQGPLETQGEKSLPGVIQQMHEGQKFYAVVQPIVLLENREKVGYEVLSRLSIPEFDQPDDFFHLSKEANMLTIVDRACLKNCIDTSLNIDPEMAVHINLFPSTIMDTPVEQIVEDFKEAKNLSRFCIEISEQQIVGDSQYLIPAVNALKKAGLKIAIDDVGFGRTSLESLILLEPEIVKIDKQFVRGIHGSPGKINALKRLLKVIKSCSAEIIAEGIEQQEDLDVLTELGVKKGQGFLFGKPAKGEEA